MLLFVRQSSRGSDAVVPNGLPATLARLWRSLKCNFLYLKFIVFVRTEIVKGRSTSGQSMYQAGSVLITSASQPAMKSNPKHKTFKIVIGAKKN